MKALEKLKLWIANKLTPEDLRLNPDQLREVADALEEARKEREGDGNAVFLSDMTEEEYEEYVRLEERGWKGFYKKLGLIKEDETTTDTNESSTTEDRAGEEDGEWIDTGE